MPELGPTFRPLGCLLRYDPGLLPENGAPDPWFAGRDLELFLKSSEPGPPYPRQPEPEVYQ